MEKQNYFQIEPFPIYCVKIYLCNGILNNISNHIFMNIPCYENMQPLINFLRDVILEIEFATPTIKSNSFKHYTIIEFLKSIISELPYYENSNKFLKDDFHKVLFGPSYLPEINTDILKKDIFNYYLKKSAYEQRRNKFIHTITFIDNLWNFIRRTINRKRDVLCEVYIHKDY